MDKVEDQKKFKDKNQLPFPLLSDTDGVLVKAYGVKKFTPKICARESFIIDKGKLAFRVQDQYGSFKTVDLKAFAKEFG